MFTRIVTTNAVILSDHKLLDRGLRVLHVSSFRTVTVRVVFFFYANVDLDSTLILLSANGHTGFKESRDD